MMNTANNTPSHPPSAEQVAVIRHLDGAILVLAPFGTGKTRVLADRVAEAVRQGRDPAGILCLTFTQRAAREMRARLLAFCPAAVPRLTLRTFHGLCAQILRAEALAAGLPADFVVYDDDDSLELVQDIFHATDRNAALEIQNLLEHAKSSANPEALADDTMQLAFAQLPPEYRPSALEYQALLRQRHALDFADLVFLVRKLFLTEADVRRRWTSRFSFVQVDEVQDTHYSEYDVIRTLAREHGNVAMIGDLDQTIYEWRGSDPEHILACFEADFHPATYHLTHNYRATRLLVEAASGFAASFANRRTHCRPGANCEPGTPIEVYMAPTEDTEGDWIAGRIERLRAATPGLSLSRVGVLARKHGRCRTVAGALERRQVPCVTVEEYEFSRRQEVKDALAYLRLLTNPHDAGALHRVLLRPARGIGEATLTTLREQGRLCGLRTADLLDPQAAVHGDPLGPLLVGLRNGTVVVLDTEATGLSTARDEVIEIAAVRLEAGKPAGEFQVLVRNTVPVGESTHVHGLTDDYLQENGTDPAHALAELARFCGSAIVVGHNIGFDLALLNAHAARADVSLPAWTSFDTCDLARRFLPTLPNHKLSTVVQHLNVAEKSTHRAMQDVMATVAILKKLAQTAAETAIERRALVTRYAPAFNGLAASVADWKNQALGLRPGSLLPYVLGASGLEEYYRRRQETRRMANLERLVAIIREQDPIVLPPVPALRAVLEFCALAKNVDQIMGTGDQVPIITIHQAKGLEFDIVFVAGAVDGEIPNYYAVQEGRTEEERRLFYVAMTRARNRLLISGYQVGKHSWHKKEPSRFLGAISSNHKVRAAQDTPAALK